MDAAQRQAAYKTATDQGGPRVPVIRQSGYLIPMGASTTAKVVGSYPIFGDNPGHAIATALKNILQPNFQKTTIPTGFQKSTPQGRKQPAIARLTERDANVAPRTSRILGTSYKARKSDSASGGAGKDDETQAVSGNPAAFTEQLETALSTWQNAGPFRTTKLIPEINFIL